MNLSDSVGISLVGDLSMIGVSEQFAAMRQHIESYEESDTGSSVRKGVGEIDLTRIESLDACGCQLLVTFLRRIGSGGTYTYSLKLTDDLREKIDTLGFRGELFGKESI
ncbi:MAG: hypothetical protein PHN84_09935 [Desulfuromonadaceae bacterium]|nr:hypothetical protein [Desulfuromonadaceae bacterium]MDD2855618.1 hypothetical protein [Desulfuromonadaceae bacterium]